MTDCPRCGATNVADARFCQRCGQNMASANPYQAPMRAEPAPVPEPAAPDAPRPPNYLVQAILVTLCCCIPFGIVAIVYAAQVDGKWRAGDIAGAQRTSGQAKMWCWLAFGLGLVVTLISVGLQVVGATLSR